MEFNFTNQLNYDLKKVDIFSLGLTILEIMFINKIRLPMRGPKWEELRNEKIPYIDDSQYSQFLKNLIKRTLSSNNQNRPSSLEIISLINSHLNQLKKNN